MCGPSGATISRRSSFIERQAFLENKVDFKSGANFAADRAVSLESHDKLTDVSGETSGAGRGPIIVKLEYCSGIT